MGERIYVNNQSDRPIRIGAYTIHRPRGSTEVLVKGPDPLSVELTFASLNAAVSWAVKQVPKTESAQ